jgi:hypothetical protein
MVPPSRLHAPLRQPDCRHSRLPASEATTPEADGLADRAGPAEADGLLAAGENPADESLLATRAALEPVGAALPPAGGAGSAEADALADAPGTAEADALALVVGLADGDAESLLATSGALETAGAALALDEAATLFAPVLSLPLPWFPWSWRTLTVVVHEAVLPAWSAPW